jgi:hypothetical protein
MPLEQVSVPEASNESRDQVGQGRMAWGSGIAVPSIRTVGYRAKF